MRDRVSLDAAQMVDVQCAWPQSAQAGTEHYDQTKANCRTAVTRHDATDGQGTSSRVVGAVVR